MATKLRAARARRGLTIEQLATMAGLHYSTVRDTDAGKRRPSLQTRIKISAAMGDDGFTLWPGESSREMRKIKALMADQK